MGEGPNIMKLRNGDSRVSSLSCDDRGELASRLDLCWGVEVAQIGVEGEDEDKESQDGYGVGKEEE